MSKNTFEFYESQHFFFDLRGNPGFEQLIEKIKSSSNVAKSRFEGLVLDIAVLLEGNVNNPKYRRAFERYTQYYIDKQTGNGFSPSELYSYCRFICETFNVQPPEIKVVDTWRQIYKPSLKLEEILKKNK